MKRIITVMIMVMCMMISGCTDDQPVSEGAKEFVIGGIAPISGENGEIGKSVR